MTLAKRVEQLIRQHGSLRAAARAIRINPAYLCRLQSGAKSNPGDAALLKLGLERVVSYRLKA